jgi:hypothetical protein
MKLYTFLLLNGLLFILSSCEKVIDMKLDTSPTQIVIQGNIYDQQGPYEVRISETKNLDQSGAYTPVNDAIVEIKDNMGTIEALSLDSDGLYKTKYIRGMVGRTYTLSVTHGDQKYKATSTMCNAVSIDSLYFRKSYFTNQSIVTVNFSDNQPDNYYRLIEFLNKKQISYFNISYNYLSEKKMTYSFYNRPENDSYTISSGDSITVWIETIDENLYNYFRTTSSSNSQSITPANPVSNFDNGALGYFNACSLRTKSVMVHE